MTMLKETARACSETAIEYWEGNLTDLQDLVEELKKDGLKFAHNLADRLVRHIKEVVERENLALSALPSWMASRKKKWWVITGVPRLTRMCWCAWNAKTAITWR